MPVEDVFASKSSLLSSSIFVSMLIDRCCCVTCIDETTEWTLTCGGLLVWYATEGPAVIPRPGTFCLSRRAQDQCMASLNCMYMCQCCGCDKNSSRRQQS